MCNIFMTPCVNENEFLLVSGGTGVSGTARSNTATNDVVRGNCMLSDRVGVN